MPQTGFERAGRQIADAVQSGRTLAIEEVARPDTLEEAEAIQDHVVALLGWTPVGWKLGASNLSSRTTLGLKRCFSAGLPESKVLRSPARLAIDAPRQPGVECELAVSFARSPGECNRLAEMPEEELRACVEAAVGGFHSAIEIPGSRYPDLGAAGPLALVADNGAADFVVVGPPAPPDFLKSGWRGTVMIDEVASLSGSSDVFCDTPLNLIVDHVRRVAIRGYDILPNAIVLLGSVTPHIRIKKPCTISVVFENLPPVVLKYSGAGLSA